jgi:DNA-binding transcriptional MerR regulator
VSTSEVSREAPPRKEKALTIGAVTKQLEREFPDISISKIRYLEDQKLLAPRRTAGGYRLYSPADVDRLRTILRLQRDEFLPLRVIRQELAAGRADTEVGSQEQPAEPRAAVRRTTFALRGPGSL